MDPKRTRRPTLLTNPAGDQRLARFAAELTTQASTTEQLEGLLRRRYPEVVVHRRELSGEDETWYVYREGRWVAEAE